MMQRACLGLLLMTALAGCGERAPVPSAAPGLPVLTRPVLTLQGPLVPFRPAQDAADFRGRPTLQIPDAALTHEAGIPGVFVLQGGQARFRVVRIAARHGSEVGILSGLRGNEVLVLGALNHVRDGSPIRPEGHP